MGVDEPFHEKGLFLCVVGKIENNYVSFIVLIDGPAPVEVEEIVKRVQLILGEKVLPPGFKITRLGMSLVPLFMVCHLSGLGICRILCGRFSGRVVGRLARNVYLPAGFAEVVCRCKER